MSYKVVELKAHHVKEEHMAENGPISSTPAKQTKICNNCGGNGYIRIDTVDGPNQVKQCWVCESEGELKKYVQKDVDNFIYEFYFNNRVQ